MTNVALVVNSGVQTGSGWPSAKRSTTNRPSYVT